MRDKDAEIRNTNIVYYGHLVNDSSAGVLSFAHDAALCIAYHNRWAVPGGTHHTVRRVRQRFLKYGMWLLWFASGYSNGYYIYASYQTCVISIGIANPLFTFAMTGIVMAIIQLGKWFIWLRKEPRTKIRGQEIDGSRWFQFWSSITLVLVLVQLVDFVIVAAFFLSNLELTCDELVHAQILVIAYTGLFFSWLSLIFCCACVTTSTLEPDMLDHDFLRQNIDAAELKLQANEMANFEKELRALEMGAKAVPVEST
eukprot:TRINITY_DN3807_c0_g1_i2.p1 TRINITY_DN3807_c0_g1~~TRINITY_DN3807_c0_g1_i2.p1  ORF type:complete len:256 (-),score=51.58 TRINITY_DN3807_c0_g1_i2:23-790(-)